MLLNEICPFVRQAIITNLNRTTKYDVNHKIKAFDCRLFYVLSGYGEIIIEGVSYPLQPRTAVIFGAAVEYEWRVDELKTYTLNFDYTYNHCDKNKSVHPVHSDSFDEHNVIEKVTFEDACELNSPMVLPDAQALEQMIRQLNTEKYLGGDYGALYTSSLLRSIIIGAVRLYRERGTTKEGRNAHIVREIIEYIEAYYSTEITNEIIAQKFNYNPSYLNRIFKQYVGMTLHSFLLTYRINMAMELLANNSISVNEVAKSVGFSDFPHFIKTFKKATGKTPGEYRKIGDN